MNYDHVIRLETIEPDVGPVLAHLNYSGEGEKLRLINKRDNLSRNYTNKLDQVTRVMAKIKPDVVEGLLKVYRTDFELFGYGWSNTSGAYFLDRNCCRGQNCRTV